MKKDVNHGLLILCLYVSTLLITGNEESCISELKAELMMEFEMTDLGHMTYFLGIEVHKTMKGLLMR